MEINSGTKLCCLLGHPVKHSISPQLHNSAFRYLGLNMVYLSFDVEPKNLSRVVKGLRSLGVVGFNVTIPHKVSIIKFLDMLDLTSKETGAVNTVVLENKKLKGYNTDVEGIRKSLLDLELEVNLRGRALIIGAGGAARAAIVALKLLGVKEMIIANRRIWKAAALARKFRKDGLKIKSISLMDVKRYSKSASIIINATPMGMWPHQDETPLYANDISSSSIVLDLVYNPLETKLLREAKNAGAKTINGLKPLIEQAVKAFQLWTGLEPPRDLLWSVAEKALESWRRNEE